MVSYLWLGRIHSQLGYELILNLDQGNIRDLVENHGGKFESTNISDCTHLIATEATVMKKTRKGGPWMYALGLTR